MTAHVVPSIAQRFREGLVFTNQPGLCPHCATAATFAQIVMQDTQNVRIVLARERCHVRTQVAQCNACGGIVFGAIERANAAQCSAIWPAEVWPDRAPPGLDSQIRKAYDEARAVLPLSPMACAVLARRALQHVIRIQLNIRKRTLFEEIEEATKRDELSKPTRNSLHHVRDIGNWSAHPEVDQADTLIDVSRDEAEYTLETLEMVFDDLYVAADRAVTMQARIQAKKAGGAAAPSA